jgi:hypothetical protein
MKPTTFFKSMIALCAGLFFAGCASTSPDYVGESYTPTAHVDVYFNANEINRPHKIMGEARSEVTEYLTFETAKLQLVKKAMQKGADAILIQGLETAVTGSYTNITGQQSASPRYVVTRDSELQNVAGIEHYQPTTMLDQPITAKFIKYQ